MGPGVRYTQLHNNVSWVIDSNCICMGSFGDIYIKHWRCDWNRYDLNYGIVRLTTPLWANLRRITGKLVIILVCLWYLQYLYSNVISLWFKIWPATLAKHNDARKMPNLIFRNITLKKTTIPNIAARRVLRILGFLICPSHRCYSNAHYCVLWHMITDLYVYGGLTPIAYMLS